MRKLLSYASILLIAVSTFGLQSCDDDSGYANVTIPPNEQFLLGEYKTGGFQVKFSNTGDVEVQIKTIDTGTKEQTSGFGLPAGSTQTVNVREGNTAVIVNDNDEEAVVRAYLDEQVEGMRYEALGE
ncbi:hypothetical protein [Phaeocystidibacter luteus]|uniref:Uncharacterized protein n=1 Tax=Phaeocystidibacter luteus TaxID=911197 RepID=A0A6N6REB4_9FLAO|nr:hypothetical protein [Phaeocystidibacter luteus]KAB2807725.1 hypothetical protein F8C67_11840 [Phaeocystidibacter luteus]